MTRASGPAAVPPEPGRVEVALQRALNNHLLSPFYRRFVDGMHLRGDERVLDYGSGGGAAARHLAKRLAAGGGRLTCIDVSERWQQALRKVLRAYPDVEYLQGDVRGMGLPGGLFDVVLVHWMLHDVPPGDRPSIVAELTRLFGREGGCSCASRPARGTACRPSRRGVSSRPQASPRPWAAWARPVCWASTIRRSGRSPPPDVGGPATGGEKGRRSRRPFSPPPLRGSPETP
ncbi:MAG: class I SAM-dependent methyltransferase [Actinobacteria bacterium]|nr:class I SAM-dependent methyltransferase [Actinomycetota bacterium]